MKLHPIQSLPSVKLALRIPGKLQTALTSYAAYYRESTGHAIEVRSLVVHMVEQFVDTDRGFQMWRRRTQSGPKGEATTR